MASPRRIACILIESGQDRTSEKIQKLAEACFRYSPQIALREREAIFLEIGKCSNLFSEQSLNHRIQALAHRFEMTVRIAFANHPCHALAKAYYPDYNSSESFSQLGLEAAICFLHPFQRSPEDERRVRTLIDTLHVLGISNFHDFLKLPPASLGSRFGAIAIWLHSYAREEREPAWVGFFPSPVIEESMELTDPEMEGTAITLEPLIFHLKSLTDSIMARLRGLGLRASQIQVLIQMAPWSVITQPNREWKISLPIPQGSSVGLIPILRDYLASELQKAPLQAPVRSLKITVLQSVPGHGAQRDFFHQKELEEENRDQLLGRLVSQLGEKHVFYAQSIDSYQPERNWVRTLSPQAPTENPSFVWRRPSRILKEPEPLVLLKSQHRPTLLLHRSGKIWKVAQWQGPERISTAWWETPSCSQVNRDYYEVTTQEGERIWVFLDLSHSPFKPFLHGYFD